MAGEKLKGYQGQIGVRDPGRSDLSGFSRAANLLDRSAVHLQQISKTAFAIAEENRTNEAIEDVNQHVFERDTNGDVIAPVLPDAGPLGYTIYEEQYRKGMLLRYRNELGSEASKVAAEIRTRNINDPDGFKVEWDEYLANVERDVPADIRGSMRDHIQQQGDAQYKSLVLEKGVADFKAARLSQESEINRANRDILMAVGRGTDLQSAQGDQLLEDYGTLLTEYADTFVNGTPEIKAAWVADRSRELQYAIVDADLTQNLLNTATGGNRSFNADEYAGSLEYISEIQAGNVVAQVPVYDEKLDQFVFMPDKIGNHLDQAQLDKLATQMRTVAKFSHQIHTARTNAVEKRINDEFFLRAMEVSQGNFGNWEVAADFAQEQLLEEYGDEARGNPEVRAALNRARLRMISFGRSEHSYHRNRLFHEMYSDVVQDTLPPQVQQVLDDEDYDMNEHKLNDPEGFNRLALATEGRLNAVNKRNAAAANAVTEFRSSMALIAAEAANGNGNPQEAAARLLQAGKLTWRSDGGTSKDRNDAEAIYQQELSDLSEEQRMQLTPETEVNAAYLPMMAGVLPKTLYQRLNSVAQIEDPSALPDGDLIRIRDTYQAIINHPNGRRIAAEVLGNRKKAFETMLRYVNSSGADSNIRKHLGSEFTDPDMLTKSGAPRTATRDDMDALRTQIIDESTSWLGTEPPHDMADEIFRSYYSVLETSTDKDVALSRAIKMTTGPDGWNENSTFHNGGRATHWTKDSLLNYWRSKKLDGFFDSREFKQMILDKDAQWHNLEPEVIGDLVGGRNYQVGFLSQYDRTNALIYERYTAADGSIITRPLGDKNGGRLIINFANEIEQYRRDQVYGRPEMEVEMEAPVPILQMMFPGETFPQ